MPANETVRRLAEDYWETVLEANPTIATMLGDHRFDDRIEDVSADGDARLRSTLAGLTRRLDTVDHAALDSTDRVSCRQLGQELGDAAPLLGRRAAPLRPRRDRREASRRVRGRRRATVRASRTGRRVRTPAPPIPG